MMQPRAKFEVGEPVYVQPADGDRFEAVVQGVKFCANKLSIVSGRIHPYMGWGYFTDPPGEGPRNLAWVEGCLRKRYPPADESFEQMMNRLKILKKETVYRGETT